MNKEHEQIEWNDQVERELAEIVRLAVQEDLGGQQDWTTVALVPAGEEAEAFVATRVDGVIAGLPAGTAVLREMGYRDTEFELLVADGSRVSAGDHVARIKGRARQILTAERPILNILGRLSGIASLAAEFVQAVEGTNVRVYDTRKTTPGYRLLEKYAVRCGGGTNHRSGLHKAVLIKDNHIAFGQDELKDGEAGFGVAEAVEKARRYVHQHAPHGEGMIVEIEVDSIEQLKNVLSSSPDIVLLDNMTPLELSQSVRIRNELAPNVELEASGGVNLQTIRRIAESGVDRISVGALTHSAPNFDVGLDWS